MRASPCDAALPAQDIVAVMLTVTIEDAHPHSGPVLDTHLWAGHCGTTRLTDVLRNEDALADILRGMMRSLVALLIASLLVSGCEYARMLPAGKTDAPAFRPTVPKLP